MLAADRDRHRAGGQVEGVERQVRRENILLEFLAAERVAEHIIEPLLARGADTDAVEGHAAIVGAGERRAADDRARGHAERVARGGEHRILREREARIVADVARHFAGAADPLLIIDVPARARSEKVEFAVGADDIALQFAPRVILADRQIGVGRAELELGNPLKRQFVAHRLRQEGIVRFDRDIALVELDAEVSEILRLGVGGLDEEVEPVGNLEAEAPEQALAVFGRVERLEAVHLRRFPVAADHPRVAHGAIVELADRSAGAENGAAQRGVGDDPARRREAEPRARHDEPLGFAVARGIGGVGDHVRPALVPVARHAVQPVLDRDLAVEQQVAASAGKGGAGGQRRAIAGSVAIGSDAIFGRSLDPGVVLVEDEVDDARHGVGAIGSRGAAGDDLDALDQALRKGVHVDQPGHRRSDRTLTVEQYERARGAERAQVERVDPGGARADVEV